MCEDKKKERTILWGKGGDIVVVMGQERGRGI